MPPAKSPTGRAKAARAEPYPASKPANKSEVDDPTNQENESPKDSASPTDKPPAAEIKTKVASKKGAGATKANPDLPDNYLDIELDECQGSSQFRDEFEVPCYEHVSPSPSLSTLRFADKPQASVIRRKLNALLDKKEKIPGSDKVFNKTTLSQQLCEIARAHHPIESSAGIRAKGPAVPALTAFLKKSGTMGGGDSETYYYGNMLLEKIRIWKGEKKSKTREKLEEE